MASVLVQAANICSGNSHARLTVTAGSHQKTIGLTLPEVIAPITVEELEAWAKLCIRIRRELDNRTNAQLRADLLTGLTVGVSV